jgi:peptidoglycan hydrolase CwlO-like protein
LDNILLISVLGILALYFFGSMNIYKSMYRKIKEEKELAEYKSDTRDKDIKKYESQLQDALQTIKDLDERLTKAREEVQQEKQKRNELRHRNELLQKRVDELYSSVGII